MSFTETLINGIWPVQLAEHRKEFHDARPLWEHGRLEHCAERMETGMVIYDVGAEEGDFTSLYRSWVGETGAVVPIEPQPAYWPAIRQTWEANGFEPPPPAWWPGFAGAETTLHDFGTNLANLGWPEQDWPGCSVGPMRPDFGFQHLAQQADATPQVRLDAFADISGTKPDAIVMDIEGAEWHALAGCEYLLADHRPLVWVSVHEGTMLEWYGTRPDDIAALMSQHGYVATELPYNGEAETFWFFEAR